MGIQVNGHCDPAFTEVQRQFENNFAEHGDVGASVAITLNGEYVVDLWAGFRDEAASEPWEEDTIVNVYSSTKTMAATCMLVLADRGELDFDAPVAKYWPEFAQKGKESVLVRHVMSHTAGLPGFDPPITVEDLYDLDKIADQLASQELWWEPGTKSGYHAVTQGNLESEILYRITGKRMGQWFQDEIAGPIGADFHIGLPASEDARVAELIPPEINPTAEPMINGVPITMDMIAGRALMSLALTATEPQTREWRAAEIPAAGGIGNARSMARVHSFLACGGEVDGQRLLSEAGVRKALEEQINNVDEVLLAELRHGIGFGISLQDWVEPRNDSTMFWGGWGGSIAVVDLENRLSIAYVMNRMETELTGDPRGSRIVEAAYASLE